MFGRLLISVAALSLLPSAAQAARIVFAGGAGGVPAGAQLIEDFDGKTSSAADHYWILTESVPNEGARPAFTTGSLPYLAVGEGGSYTLNFFPAHVVNFNLGSLDVANYLTLLFEDGSSSTLQGGQIVGAADASPLPNSGHQTLANTNGLVSIFADSGPRLTGMRLSATMNSFEIDQVSISAPEPQTWAYMIMGFGLIGAVVRRRRLGAVGA